MSLGFDVSQQVTEVTGVEYKDAEGQRQQAFGDAVILACGGYGADRGPDSLLRKYCPQVRLFFLFFYFFNFFIILFFYYFIILLFYYLFIYFF